ncbi:MAG: alpha/beta hydrolase [Candidatus Lokiarchaeota archaeon]|nr:alpha/beta hydrolase [Candidatus Lokiarchaeota archaeon]
MKSSTFTFKDPGGIEIFVYKWEPDTSPKAAIQIVHGLAEHAKRYTRVAEVLCNQGYICYANDQRGHGLTAGDLTEATLEGHAGVLGDNGWEGIVDDIHQLSDIIKKENPNLPLFLLGHSWGAFLAQDYIQQWGNELKGCILSGTNGKVRGLVIRAGKIILKGEIKKLAPTTPSQKMYDMNFKTNNRDWKKDEGATGFEWLSRDKNEVQKYIDDPWCGFVPPASLWLEFLLGFEKIYNSHNEQKIPKELPIHFIAGSLDPIGNKTKGVRAMINRLKKYGNTKVTYKFYEDSRHELFNETNRDDVFRDVIEWLNLQL